MHLFVAICDSTEDLARRAIGALRQAAGIYPQLDATTFWSFSDRSPVFAAGLHHGHDAIGPRIYQSQSDRQVTFYDGLPLDTTGRFDAHDAAVLGENWQNLHPVLEGRYVALRLDTGSSTLEAIIDPLGSYQLFTLEHDGACLLSNSVRVLAQIGQKTQLDPVAISLALCLNRVSDHRTLLSDIRVMPGGRRWSWRPGKGRFQHETTSHRPNYRSLKGKGLPGGELSCWPTSFATCIRLLPVLACRVVLSPVGVIRGSWPRAAPRPVLRLITSRLASWTTSILVSVVRWPIA